MKRRTVGVAVVLGIIGLLGLVVLAGCAGRSTTETGSTGMSVGAPASPPDQTTVSKSNAAGALGSAPARAAGSAESVSAPVAEKLVITTASIAVEVQNLDRAVTRVRAIAAKYGGSIADLSMAAGGQPEPAPQPLDGSAPYASPTPGGATITLRIPAGKLTAAEADAASLGRVVSQSSSENDVTQQHIDMGARLKNLQAEEARLRSFFRQATRVSEMLAIEQELSRVRGDIESLQAQITYLENQAAQATLTITLSEPGALVSPAAGGWGFSAAVREGVRAAASLIGGLITFVIAFSPLIALGLLLWFAIRVWLRRRRQRRESAAPADRLGSHDQNATD